MRTRLLTLLAASFTTLLLAADAAPVNAQATNRETGAQSPSMTMPPPAARGRAGGRANRTATGEFASEAAAKAHCPSDTVVWANTRSHVYHLAGTPQYGKTKHGAYMCEGETAAAGFRAARHERRSAL